MKKLLGSVLFFVFTVIATALVIVAPVAAANDCHEPPDPGVCSSILPESWCQPGGIAEILGLILDIMTMGIGVLATVGLVISGIQWLTSRDNESQVIKAKSRIFNIVIGILTWALIWLLLSWLLPGGLILGDPTAGTSVGDCPAGEWEGLHPKPPPPTPGPGTIPPGGGEGVFAPGDPRASSVNVPCPAGTTDVGISDGWSNGVRTNYRFCRIPSVSNVMVNSNMAASFDAMGNAAKAAGITLTHAGGFRSFDTALNGCNATKNNAAKRAEVEAQRRNGRIYPRGNCGNSVSYAWPGYSNHQAGVAIDFEIQCNFTMNSDCNTPMYQWIKANAGKFGLKRNSGEYWHYSPDGG
ncbi:M15 family metallopeptidase [Candidatus Saccharibacteria bacterium]|nr:M15 family metallopeptidase [Candidatus Saccharibacteria bacterium]